MQEEMNGKLPAKKMPKWLWWVIGIVAVVILAGGGYWLGVRAGKADTSDETATATSSSTIASTTSSTTSSTADPYAGWKTLTNTVYGYEIKYPDNWNIGSKGGADPTTASNVFFDNGCNYDAGDRCLSIFLYIDENQSWKNLEDAANDIKDNRCGDPSTVEPDKLGGELAYKIVGVQNGGYCKHDEYDGAIIDYVAVHDDNYYRLQLGENGQDLAGDITTDNWKSLDLLEKIKSSFKFTK